MIIFLQPTHKQETPPLTLTVLATIATSGELGRKPLVCMERVEVLL